MADTASAIPFCLWWNSFFLKHKFLPFFYQKKSSLIFLRLHYLLVSGHSIHSYKYQIFLLLKNSFSFPGPFYRCESWNIEETFKNWNDFYKQNKTKCSIHIFNIKDNIALIDAYLRNIGEWGCKFIFSLFRQIRKWLKIEKIITSYQLWAYAVQ